ncbi:unnamed protein product [Vitrella brassicaformis CCMP3155]|uniref:Peroxisomal membrane protein MPV17 n=1 Tax=Vitrella brassicaformis (strain CCMP3155) TaxID=1169540 RepID=A0A0G4GJL4_VITBC|nr:unnamed protein product [Vitrella brassicaformis CCMP3155]|eukprot:CEM30109.1 unnamed protein product [Vitrella brassicaformis CCMP3155]
MKVFRRFFQWYKAKYDDWPYLMAFATCGIKASASDVITQRNVEGCESLDVARNAKFALFGAAYTGCAQHFWYNVVFPRFLGTGCSLVVVTRKVLCELFVHTPLSYFPVYYVFKAVLNGKRPLEGLYEYRGEAASVLPHYWMLWTPGHIMTFAVIPPQFRIAWVAGVSFCWSIILSHLAPMKAEVEVGGHQTHNHDHGQRDESGVGVPLMHVAMPATQG